MIKRQIHYRPPLRLLIINNYMKCLICNNDYKHLGSHLKQHRVTARDYKMEFGMDLNFSLMDDDIIQKKRDAFWDNPTLDNLKKAEKFKYKKGCNHKKEYLSNNVKNRLKGMCNNRLIQDKVGDIYENSKVLKRRRIENILWHEDKIIYTTSCNNNGVWSDFAYEAFKCCTREQFHKSGKKIN